VNTENTPSGDQHEPVALGITGSLADAADEVAAEAGILSAQVAEPWEVSLVEFPDVSSLRRLVRHRLAVVLHPDVLTDLLMVVGELVTNAYLHAVLPRRLRLSRVAEELRVEVSDGDPAPPVLRPFSLTVLGGRGVLLVDRLCLRWGVLPEIDGDGVHGKIVWAVLPERTR